MGREYVLAPAGLGSAALRLRPEFAIQPTSEWAAAQAAGLGAQRRNAPEAGLSKLHNVTDGRSDRRLGERSSTLTIAVGGSLVTVRTPRRGEPPPPLCAGAKGLFPMPRRYKARNNSTARLSVDADRFRADLERARRLGLFDRSASCGSGVWSREELCPF